MNKDHTNTDRATVIAGPDVDLRDRPPRLIVVSGVFLGHQLEIGHEPIVIGRAAEATLSLPHPSVSRSHCRVWIEGDRFFIEDLGSTNKTYLNGQAVMRAELSDGDQIGVGNHALKFFRGASPEARYHQELIDLAVHDGLTGFFNRRHFRMLLDDHVERARSGIDLGVLIVDLDHFKQINDRYSHLAGDAVLKLAAERMRAQLPEQALVGRWGGEEFIVVMESVNQAEALAMAEQLRQTIDHSLAWDGSTIRFSGSIGVAVLEQATFNSADEWIAASDRALYRAKREGRNRIHLASRDPAEDLNLHTRATD